MTPSCHLIPLCQHVPKAELLAMDLEAEPVFGVDKLIERRYEHVIFRNGGSRQPDGQNDLMWKEFIIHVFLGTPGEQVIVLIHCELVR